MPGVDVDRYQRFGVVDHDVPARFQPNLRTQPLINLLLDAELLVNRRFLGVKLHAAHQRRLETAHEIDNLGVLLLRIHPNRRVVGADVIAQHALHQIQIAVQ